MRAIAIAALALALVIDVVAGQSPKRLPIVAGNSSVKILVEVDGTVKMWGDSDGTPGFGDGLKNVPRKIDSPQQVPGLHDIANAAIGGGHALLLTRDGTVLAWGKNGSCALGNGTDKDASAPMPVPGLRNVTQVAAGTNVSAAVLADGTVWMWGDGRNGALGNGSIGFRTPCARMPTRVEGVDHVARVALDGESVLALREDGTVLGWGKNGNGGLCDGTTEPELHPIQVKGIAGAVDIAISGNSVFVLVDGTVRMCGRETDGELGDGRQRADGLAVEHLTPFKVPGLTTVKSVNTNRGTTIVRLADGTLRAWGNGYYGALGDGRGDSSSVRPKAPIGLGPVIAHYATSSNESYAIRADGSVMVWSIPAPKGDTTEFSLAPRLAPFTVKIDN